MQARPSLHRGKNFGLKDIQFFWRGLITVKYQNITTDLQDASQCTIDWCWFSKLLFRLFFSVCDKTCKTVRPAGGSAAQNTSSTTKTDYILQTYNQYCHEIKPWTTQLSIYLFSISAYFIIFVYFHCVRSVFWTLSMSQKSDPGVKTHFIPAASFFHIPLSISSRAR